MDRAALAERATFSSALVAEAEGRQAQELRQQVEALSSHVEAAELDARVFKHKLDAIREDAAANEQVTISTLDKLALPQHSFNPPTVPLTLYFLDASQDPIPC